MMKYIVEIIESLLLICFIIVKLFNGTLSYPYPVWIRIGTIGRILDLSQIGKDLSIISLPQFVPTFIHAHHFETYEHEFQHPLCRMWRPSILDSDKYSNYNKTHICILLYVGIYIFPC